MSKNKMLEKFLDIVTTSRNEMQYKDNDVTLDEKLNYALGQLDLAYELDIIDDEWKDKLYNEIIEMHHEVTGNKM